MVTSGGLTNRMHICWVCQRVREQWDLAAIIHGDNEPRLAYEAHGTYCYSRRFTFKAKHSYQSILKR